MIHLDKFTLHVLNVYIIKDINRIKMKHKYNQPTAISFYFFRCISVDICFGIIRFLISNSIIGINYWGKLNRGNKKNKDSPSLSFSLSFF